MLKPLPTAAISTLHPLLQDPVEYRKSGLSLNHVLGCPINCAYCIRHIYDNYSMKSPKLLMRDEDAVEQLLSHRYFQPHITPLQLFNRATDPLLDSVKPHTFRTLELLSSNNLTNHLLLITRFRLTEDDAQRLNCFKPLKLTVLFTYSGITDPAIEPINSNISAESLRTAYRIAENFKTILYWRPIVPGLNDSVQHVKDAANHSKNAHATVFTGLFYRDEIKRYFDAHGISTPYQNAARRKILPLESELDLIEKFSKNGGERLFKKTSCAVSYVHSLPDYNGHYGIRELCNICPKQQIRRCSKSWLRPKKEDLLIAAKRIGVDPEPTNISDRSIIFPSLPEQDRYYLQHTLGFQIHDSTHPHYINRHGRSESIRTI